MRLTFQAWPLSNEASALVNRESLALARVDAKAMHRAEQGPRSLVGSRRESCVPGWRTVNHTAWDPRAPPNCRDVRTRSVLCLLVGLVDVTKFATINLALCGNCQNCRYWPTTHADHPGPLPRPPTWPPRGRTRGYRTSGPVDIGSMPEVRACEAGGEGSAEGEEMGRGGRSAATNLRARRNPNWVTAGHAQAGCCPFSPIYSCRRCAHRLWRRDGAEPSPAGGGSAG